MASLVADYSDSDGSFSDDEEQINTHTASASASPEESEQKLHEAKDVKPVVKEEPSDAVSNKQNFFSTEDREDSDEDKKEVKNELSPSSSRLPNPLASSKEPEKLPSMREATTSRIGTSVFVNLFEEAEQAKKSILEKHVRLTEAAPKKPAHQPLCWKFKKGRCALGKNCRFFHDTSNVSAPEGSSTNQSEDSPSSSGSKRQVYHQSVIRRSQHSGFRPLEPEPVDDDNYMAGAKRKKRFGVNDHLVPPQKAFNALMAQRMKERPWTVDQKNNQGW